MATLNLAEKIEEEAKRIDSMEQVLGKGLNQPFASHNSGSRKNLASTQADQKMPLSYSEVPLIMTGYENQFGENSSSYKEAKHNYQVLKKINKFEDSNTIYYLIVKNLDTNEIDVIERINYCHITESYGYLINNEYLDHLNEHSYINSGDIYQKSTSFDQYNNRTDGVNLITQYLACNKTTEDGIILSKSASEKLASPLLNRVTIIINDNDIPLNIYGDSTTYKPLPNIGEEIANGLLCAIRREKKEECLYTQSIHQLGTIMMSDEKFITHGKVLDVNLYCNNSEKLGQEYTGQFKYYHDQQHRFANELVRFVDSFINAGYKLSYDLQKLYSVNKRMLSGTQYIKDKLFSNIIMEVILLDEIPMHIGDKLTDRYGGKGVVSEIRDDELMPLLDNGERVEIIYNQSTCINRLNPGQLFEVSINCITERLREMIGTKVFDASVFIKMYLDLIRILSPSQAEEFEAILSQVSDEDAMWYLNDLYENGLIIVMQPISEIMTIDKLAAIYDAFPWAKPYNVIVPIKDSNGNYRYIEASRTLPIGKKYIYRLKQYAKNKFSVTSLSSTNLKNETSRNRSCKDYKAPYPRTPIRFGEMEMGDMGHLGMEVAIVQLMIYSVSPIARRSCEQMLTGDPFDIDIKLDENASNRSVEIFNAYFKTMGYRLVFEKRKKKYTAPLSTSPIGIVNINAPGLMKYPISYANPDSSFKFDLTNTIKETIDYYENHIEQPKLEQPIEYHTTEEDALNELDEYTLWQSQRTEKPNANWKRNIDED